MQLKRNKANYIISPKNLAKMNSSRYQDFLLLVYFWGNNPASTHLLGQQQQSERIYVQVCLKLPDTSDREIENLLEIKDHYPKYVVTMDDLAAGNVNGIKICHLADFLLREDY